MVEKNIAGFKICCEQRQVLPHCLIAFVPVQRLTLCIPSEQHQQYQQCCQWNSHANILCYVIWLFISCMLKTKELLLLLLHSSLETAVIIIVCAQLQIKNVYFLIHSKVVHCFLIMPIEIKANNHTILITVTISISFVYISFFLSVVFL